MTNSWNFEYYYGDESEQFSFLRIPRQLITGAAYKKVSIDAKLLYGLMLDRMGLSAGTAGMTNRGGSISTLPPRRSGKPCVVEMTRH